MLDQLCSLPDCFVHFVRPSPSCVLAQPLPSPCPALAQPLPVLANPNPEPDPNPNPNPNPNPYSNPNLLAGYLFSIRRFIRLLPCTLLGTILYPVQLLCCTLQGPVADTKVVLNSPPEGTLSYRGAAHVPHLSRISSA